MGPTLPPRVTLVINWKTQNSLIPAAQMENPLNLALNSHTSQLPLLLIHNHNHLEMIALQTVSYISLKDMIPVRSPPLITSTMACRRDILPEIPIKDPLLKHAARAYLQPMAAERDDHTRWWRGLHDKFCGLFGCLNGVALMAFDRWFPKQGSRRLTVDDDDDEVN